jgi:uncharacterized protein (DUF58 family)
MQAPNHELRNLTLLPEPEIRLLAELYRLDLTGSRAAGTVGALQGRETGASVEIQDFRDYVPGDDPRRIDWMSYARTGEMIVRLYREEVSPFFDIVVDTSASMALDDGRKGDLTHELVRWLYHSARGGGVTARVLAAGESLVRLQGPDELDLAEPRSVLFTTPRAAVAGLRRCSVRLLISDFMDETAPTHVVRALAAGCARLIVFHVLGPWEADPTPAGPVVLESVETHNRTDLSLTHSTVIDYLERLLAMRDELRQAMLQCGGTLAEIRADQNLETTLREDLMPLGLIDA